MCFCPHCIHCISLLHCLSSLSAVLYLCVNKPLYLTAGDVCLLIVTDITVVCVCVCVTEHAALHQQSLHTQPGQAEYIFTMSASGNLSFFLQNNRLHSEVCSVCSFHILLLLFKKRHSDRSRGFQRAAGSYKLNMWVLKHSREINKNT